MTANRTYPTTGEETDESHDDTTPTLPLTRRWALQAAGAAAGTASITGASTAADGGTLAGPHDTPGPLPDAGRDERTLFQAVVDGGHCRLDPPGARTGIQARDRDPIGGVRVWVLDGDTHSPKPRVTVAVRDDREVVTITATACPDADTLREWAGNIRHRTDDTGTVGINGAEVRLASRGGGAEVRDSDPDGGVSVGWTDYHAGVSVGVGTGDSWARVRVDDERDELAHAAETAAEVIDDE